MKKLLKFEFIFFLILSILVILLTIIQSTKQDFTSIIDFDLTVIHNSLQLVSNKYPDFTDHTAYSQFLTLGLFYKFFNLFDSNLISNIEFLIKSENPEISLQKLYIISRIANSIILIITLIFFNKICKTFNVKKKYIYLFIFFLILSETFIANFNILRADIFAICFFFISFFYLLNFTKSKKISDLFLVSFFMTFSLLAKVQIIFSYMFLFYFFVYYFFFETKKNINLNYNLFSSKILNKYLKYLLIIFVFNYFLFQFYLNNYVNSSTPVGYFDLFCFSIYFLIMIITIYYMYKYKTNLRENLLNIFSLIIIFFIFQIFLIKILNILNIIQIDFNIFFSLTNPFYFLKSYSPFLDDKFSISLVIKMIITLFKSFNFNFIYFLILIIIFLRSFYKISFWEDNDNENYNYLYIFLFSLFTIFLVTINNFRYNVVYNMYSLPILFLSLSYILSIMKHKLKLLTSIITVILIFNIFFNFNNFKQYIYKSSNLEKVCGNNSIRNFYYYWARNFDENFFKKICINKEITFE